MFKNYQQYLNYRNCKSQSQACARSRDETFLDENSGKSALVRDSSTQNCSHCCNRNYKSNCNTRILSCDKGAQASFATATPSTQITVPIEVPPSEPFDTENFHGSIQQVLYENVGKCVNCEFLVGTAVTTIKSGIIYYVGRTYLILYSPTTAEYILCDIFSVKFVTFVKLTNCLN